MEQIELEAGARAGRGESGADVAVLQPEVPAPVSRDVDLAGIDNGLDLWVTSFRALDPAQAPLRRPVFPHPSFWRWVAFDPPMRDPNSLACLPRRVMCRVCDVELGVTDDPIDALLIARRHRRELRRPR